MQCNAMQCNAMQCNAMQCNAMHVCLSVCPACPAWPVCPTWPACLYVCMSVCLWRRVLPYVGVTGMGHSSGLLFMTCFRRNEWSLMACFPRFGFCIYVNCNGLVLFVDGMLIPWEPLLVRTCWCNLLSWSMVLRNIS